MNNQMLNSQMYEEYCYNRLPCGICRLTNSQCPKCVGIDINWCNNPDSVTTTPNVNLKDSNISFTKCTTKLGDITTDSVKCTTKLGDVTTEVTA